MNSTSFMVTSLEFSVRRKFSILSPANSDSFTSSFPIWIPLNSCVIVVVRTSNIMLNINGVTQAVFSRACPLCGLHVSLWWADHCGQSGGLV